MFTMTIRTRDLHTAAHKHQHRAHLVDEDDLEGLRLLGLPDCDLALREERVAQAHREDVKCILTGLGGSEVCCSARGACGLWGTRVEAGDEHDRCELHKQLGWVGVHVEMLLLSSSSSMRNGSTFK